MIMKKTILIISLALMTLGAKAQDNNIFNHVSFGVDLGTTGIGFEVAAPITDYVAVRAGMDFMPQFKYGTDVDLKIPQNIPAGYNIPNSLDIEGKLKLTQGKLLFDAYPFQTSSFHLTVGAYFGGKEVIEVYNKENGILMDVTKFNQDFPDKKIGAKIGDYLLTPDKNGNVTGSIEVGGFRPYVGFGFGRAIPKKHRFGCCVDAGVLFWGSPKVMNDGTELSKDNLDGGGGFVKTMTTLSVYPCVSVKFVGRIL